MGQSRLPVEGWRVRNSQASRRVDQALGGVAGMKPIDRIIWTLALVRFGQELGTDSPLARAVARAIEAALWALR